MLNNANVTLYTLDFKQILKKCIDIIGNYVLFILTFGNKKFTYKKRLAFASLFIMSITSY